MRQDATGTHNVNSTTYCTIKNVNSGQLADVYQAGTGDGVNVVQWPSNGGTHQQSNIVKVSGQLYKMVNRISGKALAINGSSHSKGANLQQCTYSGGNNQLWYFEPTSGGYVIRNFGSRQDLEAGGNSTANGAAINRWMALNQTHQAWTIQ
ncbi:MULTISPECIES: RICIN domain-containing protein [Streptomyces]|uniref:RICIN domain-containing protein n=1 Tax=Streptomyces TaxID=1883 RepID=UPI000CF22644|nr:MULTISPECIES: RICIN domain-containing protein [Streptomyces]